VAGSAQTGACSNICNNRAMLPEPCPAQQAAAKEQSHHHPGRRQQPIRKEMDLGQRKQHQPKDEDPTHQSGLPNHLQRLAKTLPHSCNHTSPQPYSSSCSLKLNRPYYQMVQDFSLHRPFIPSLPSFSQEDVTHSQRPSACLYRISRLLLFSGQPHFEVLAQFRARYRPFRHSPRLVNIWTV